MEGMSEKVIYILPKYDDKTDTHLFYNYELIRAASSAIDIYAVIENAVSPINLNVPFLVQKHKKGIARFFELYFILRRLKKEGYNNIYVHYSYYGALAGWLARLRVSYWNCGMPWLFRRGFFEERCFRFILRHTTLVTGSKSLAEEYVKHFRVRKWKIVSNWVDAGRFLPKESKEATKSWFGIKGSTKLILFVHHLSERKGADLLVPIISYIRDSDAVLFVVGDGPYRESLEAEALGSHIPVKVIGPVPNRDMVAYYQAADAFLMPSREEGVPHSLLEAMAAGTPFVASDVGGVRDIAPAGFEEFLIKPGDVAEFGKKIRKLLADEELYDKFRKAGLEFAEKFGKEREVREFISLFNTEN